MSESAVYTSSFPRQGCSCRVKLYLRLPKDKLGEISGLGLGDSKNSRGRQDTRQLMYLYTSARTKAGLSSRIFTSILTLCVILKSFQNRTQTLVHNGNQFHGSNFILLILLCCVYMAQNSQARCVQLCFPAESEIF